MSSLPSFRKRKQPPLSAEDQEFAALLKERERDEAVEEQLEEMYRSEAADAPGVTADTASATVFERGGNPWYRVAVLFIVLLALLSAASWAAFLWLNGGREGMAHDVTVAVQGPREVKVGEKIVYEILYRNTGEFALTEARLALTLPPGVYLADTVPAYAETAPPEGRTLVWALDGLEAQRNGRVQVQVVVAAPQDASLPLAATLTYRPANFSSDFTVSADEVLAIANLGVHAAVEAPGFVNNNAEVTADIEYAKTRGSAIEGLVVWVEHGPYFTLSEGMQLPLPLASLSETPARTAVKGRFTAVPRAGEGVRIHVGIPADALPGATAPQPLVTYDWQPTVVDNALSLSLTANGSAAGRPVNFGERINYVLHYRNTSDQTLENVALLAVIDSPAVDWNTFESSSHGEVADNAVMWTSNEIGELASVPAGREGSVSFSVALKGVAAAASLGSSQAAVTANANYSVGGSPNAGGEPAARITSPINSDFTVTEEVRYFGRDGSAIGGGPWPPQVGETTVLEVTWAATNSLHDLRNIETVVTLPTGVEWRNDATATQGSIAYDAAGRTVRWSTGDWDAESEPIIVRFTVGVTPQESHRNTVMKVLDAARAEAKDVASGAVIVRTLPVKTTALPDDETASGNGTVR